jgi:hypothetical protein
VQVFKYDISGTTYIQKPLVLGQIRQMRGVLDGLAISPSEGSAGLILALEDRLGLALAVVLTKEGETLKDKDLHALADEIEFAITGETIMKVVDDFFTCNPVASLFEKVTGIVKKIRAAIPTGSRTSVSSLPTEISPKETPSCGDSPQESAAPT